VLLRRHSDKIDELKKVPLFSALNRRHLDIIARHADEVKREAGTVLARQGARGLEFLLIVEGSARVEKDGKVIAHLGAGDFFGEMSLLDGKPRSATVIADSPVVLLVVGVRSFGRLLETVPGLSNKVMATLCERLRAADETLTHRN
jgi:CRP/FNR family cyclic AMP-dependent transcriptional regulator